MRVTVREFEADTEQTTGCINHVGAVIEPILPHPPRLQRAAGHVEPRGCLALGDPLSRQCAVSCQEVSAFEAPPALGAIMVVTVLCLAYRCPSSLPTEAPTMAEVEGEGWRGSSLVAISLGIESYVFSVIIETRWPTP